MSWTHDTMIERPRCQHWARDTARTVVTWLLIAMLPEKRSAHRSSYWIHDNITSQFRWTYSLLRDRFPRLVIFSRSWFGPFPFIFAVSLLYRLHSIMVSTERPFIVWPPILVRTFDAFRNIIKTASPTLAASSKRSKRLVFSCGGRRTDSIILKCVVAIAHGSSFHPIVTHLRTADHKLHNLFTSPTDSDILDPPRCACLKVWFLVNVKCARWTMCLISVDARAFKLFLYKLGLLYRRYRVTTPRAKHLCVYFVQIHFFWFLYTPYMCIGYTL